MISDLSYTRNRMIPAENVSPSDEYRRDAEKRILCALSDLKESIIGIEKDFEIDIRSVPDAHERRV
jgi:hypothetical protein